MNEANQVNKPDDSSIAPLKRKRGRPRKYPATDLDHGGNIHFMQSGNRGGYSRTLPGSGEVNGNQLHRGDPVSNVNNAMVGQMVHGVIEAAFDAGYLLAVRVGNSETALRGVVFRPGHYVPISADNDVAPDVQMIGRNEVPLPRVNYAQVHGRNRRFRDRNGTSHATQSSNPGTSKGKQVASVVTQTSTAGFSLGTKPVAAPNGVPAVSYPLDGSQAAHPGPQKGKEITVAAYPSNGSTPVNQALHLHMENNHTTTPSGAPSETGPSNHKLSEALIDADAKSLKLPGKLLMDDSGISADGDVGDPNQALSVEPLRVFQPDGHGHPAATSRPPENFENGKLTTLLQESMETWMTESQEQVSDSGPKPDGMTGTAEPGSDENGRAEKSD